MFYRSKLIILKYNFLFLYIRMFFQTDVYSCGIVFCEILLGFHPLLAENEKATIDNIINGKIVELPNWVPTEIKELVMNMMNVVCNKNK